MSLGCSQTKLSSGQAAESLVKGECKSSAPAWPSRYIKMLVLVLIEVSLQSQTEFASRQSTFKWKTKENVKHSVSEKGSHRELNI